MNTESKEHLSTLMDGEINRETGRFMIRRLGADPELQKTWGRYHLVRDCLRHQDGGLAADGLCERVRQALEDDVPQKAPLSVPARWLKPVAGVAIAASVALMAVVAVTPGQQTALNPASELVESGSTESFTSPNILSRGPLSQQASLSGGSDSNAGAGNNDNRMNAYLLRHYQVAGSAGGKGFVSFVPIVVTQAPAQQSEVQDEADQEGESTQ
jgi:sigma-E factor negative regulatory protein RseA